MLLYCRDLPGPRRTLSLKLPGNAVRTSMACLTQGLAKANIFEIVVVHAEEVRDFMHERGFHFVFDFFGRITFIFDGALENEYVGKIENEKRNSENLLRNILQQGAARLC